MQKNIYRQVDRNINKERKTEAQYGSGFGPLVLRRFFRRRQLGRNGALGSAARSADERVHQDRERTSQARQQGPRGDTRNEMPAN